jgi:hypothetical protein
MPGTKSCGNPKTEEADVVGDAAHESAPIHAVMTRIVVRVTCGRAEGLPGFPRCLVLILIIGNFGVSRTDLTRDGSD